MKTPALSNEELEQIKELDQGGLHTVTLSTLFHPAGGADALERALDDLCRNASEAITAGATILVLSDRGVDVDHAPIPALLAVSAVHHHLIREGTRTRCGLIVESGEPREIHHFALLAGYGAGAFNPYLAYETVTGMAEQGVIKGVSGAEAVEHYRKAIGKGLLKVMSKMGISTLQSYHGAQIFEAVGLSRELIDKYFTWTASQIEGIGLEEIAAEIKARHDHAYTVSPSLDGELDPGGQYQWRRRGEYHAYNPETIARLQHSVRSGSYRQFKHYSALVNDHSEKLCTLRGLLKFKPGVPIPIEEVEPASEIVKRFKTGAMSLGSISREAHENLAIAMNRIGGKSNTGEGGEDPVRYVRDENGDLRRSAIKQVASGRFGVTSYYLVNADELQIKIAQGAKPGEGGQLPGHKVDEYIAKIRYSTPGVGLISPPPHHDIYSIEDIAQLIHDLKNANNRARVSVKLVSEVGVGTVAAGVCKAKADVVLISGYEGGTGASPLTSIKHAGTPWELGLAETQQVLVMNNLRGRIRVETDGQLKTGRDVAIAALLGAEEFGFATAALVASGCIIMRVCHLNTCPVGIATQDPVLRKKFEGKPEHVVNFMMFVAEELREIMAELGFRTVDEMVGRVDMLEPRDAIEHWKAKGVDLTPDAAQARRAGRRADPLRRAPGPRPRQGARQPADRARAAGARARRAGDDRAADPQRQPHRRHDAVGGDLPPLRRGGPAARHDPDPLPRVGRAELRGVPAPKASRSGSRATPTTTSPRACRRGRIVVRAAARIDVRPRRELDRRQRRRSTAPPAAKSSCAGIAGERFAVRNSGATAVVEGVGDHGCEYMTKGLVVVLGKTGRNFAAGMSGGVAYVLDADGRLRAQLQQGNGRARAARRRGRQDRPRPGAQALRLHREQARLARAVGLEGERQEIRQGHAGRVPQGARGAAPRQRRSEAGLDLIATTSRCRALRAVSRDSTERMGKITGFMEIHSRDAAAAAGRGAPEGLARARGQACRKTSSAEQGARCMDCGIPFCHKGCPLGNIIPDWNDLVYRGRWKEAIQRLHSTNNFPEFTGRVCPAPCEEACVLNINDDPVTIKQIEKQIIDHAFAEGWVTPQPPAAPHRQACRRRRLRASGPGVRATAGARGSSR